MESQKQVIFGYGMKTRRTGAVAITPPPSTQEKNGKQRGKKTQKQRREGSNPLIRSPTAAVDSTTLLKHPLTHSLTEKKNEKKSQKKKIRKERARTRSSGDLLL